LSRTILLIDPNLALAAKIAKFLEDFGHSVEFTSSKNEGLGAIKAFDPCLVIAAFSLPDGDALDLVKTMRDALHNQAPVLVMATPKQIEHYSDRPMPNSPQGWLKQPVDQMDMYNMINSWIGRQIDLSPPVASTPPTPHEEPMRIKVAMPPRDVEEEETKTPATSQIGNLARVPVARLFYHLGRRQLTGLMILNNPPTKIDVHFDKGSVVNVVSNYIPELSLGVLLAKKMVLTPQELVGARKRWEREGGMFGQILLKMGLIDEPTLQANLVAQRVMKLVHLFSWNWRKGTYVFHRDPNEVMAVAGFKLLYPHVILAGIRTHYDLDRLMMVFNKHNRKQQAVQLNDCQVNSLASKSDLPKLEQFVASISGHKIVQTAMEKSGLTELEFYQFAYALFVQDILVFEDESHQ